MVGSTVTLSAKSSSVITTLVVLVLISFTLEIKAEVEYRLDLAHGGTWHDAEKSRSNKDDDWLCWASSASNVLAWTKWGEDKGFTDEDQIFDYYTQHWNDHPSGSPREAWRWWFTGTNHSSSGAQVIKEGGEFWPRVNYPHKKWGHPVGSLFLGIGQNQLQRKPYILRYLLESGYGVVLQIVRPLGDGSRDSHMITLWGFRYEQWNRFKGILITDSDDAKEATLGNQAQNSLVYYPVELKEKFWWFHFRGNEWKILAAYALREKSLYL